MAVRRPSDTGSLESINNADFDQAGNEMHLSTFYYDFIRVGARTDGRKKRKAQTLDLAEIRR